MTPPRGVPRKTPLEDVTQYGGSKAFKVQDADEYQPVPSDKNTTTGEVLPVPIPITYEEVFPSKEAERFDQRARRSQRVGRNSSFSPPPPPPPPRPDAWLAAVSLGLN
eukprot:SAG11_NODE_585_length_8349_cov_38.121939_1_plen_108_part_00